MNDSFSSIGSEVPSVVRSGSGGQGSKIYRVKTIDKIIVVEMNINKNNI